MRDNSVKDKCIYVKLPYKGTEKIYTELLKDKAEKRELTLFIRNLLEAYFEDDFVRSEVDKYVYANSPSNIINSKLTNILKERERLCSLLDTIQSSGGFSASDGQGYRDTDVSIDVVKSKCIRDIAYVEPATDLASSTSVAEDVVVEDLSEFGLDVVASGSPGGGSEVDKEFMQLFESMV